MIVKGAQIRAARALVGLRVQDLAEAAGLNPNAVRYWELHEQISTNREEPDGLQRIRKALAACGVETFASPAPGVRFNTVAGTR